MINVTSTAGQRGEARYSPYAAGKGAMISATKAWSSELAPEVRVNSVAPGWVETDMTVDAFAEGRLEEIERGIPLGRVASAEDVAGSVVFLASPLARHITGEILNVNGGAVLVGIGRIDRAGERRSGHGRIPSPPPWYHPLVLAHKTLT